VWGGGSVWHPIPGELRVERTALRFLAGCCRRRLNQALSVLCLSLRLYRCKDACCTYYSIASHISIFLSSQLSNHTHFQLSQSVCLSSVATSHVSSNFFHLRYFLYSRIYQNFLNHRHLHVPVISHSSLPCNMVKPANSVVLRPIVSKYHSNR